MKHEINTDVAAASAAASAATTVAPTVKTVVKTKAAAEAAAEAAAASVYISSFIFISNFQFLTFDPNFYLYFITLILHMGVVPDPP